jgi:hypothetical protein
MDTSPFLLICVATSCLALAYILRKKKASSKQFIPEKDTRNTTEYHANDYKMNNFSNVDDFIKDKLNKPQEQKSPDNSDRHSILNHLTDKQKNKLVKIHQESLNVIAEKTTDDLESVKKLQKDISENIHKIAKDFTWIVEKTHTSVDTHSYFLILNENIENLTSCINDLKKNIKNKLSVAESLRVVKIVEEASVYFAIQCGGKAILQSMIEEKEKIISDVETDCLKFIDSIIFLLKDINQLSVGADDIFILSDSKYNLVEQIKQIIEKYLVTKGFVDMEAIRKGLSNYSHDVSEIIRQYFYIIAKDQKSKTNETRFLLNPIEKNKVD